MAKRKKKDKRARKRREQRELARVRRQSAHDEMFARMCDEVAPIIDAAFMGLDIELRQWPDGWVVDAHGTGGNPHVFFTHGDSQRGRCPCGAWKLLGRAEPRLMVDDPSPIARQHNTTTINRTISENYGRGVMVQLPPGVIYLDSGIRITGDEIGVCGAVDKTTLSSSDDEMAIISVGNSSFIEIRSLHLHRESGAGDADIALIGGSGVADS